MTILNINKILPNQCNLWINDDLVINCYNCNKLFTLYNRKHHCRSCGKIFCSNCLLNNIYSNINSNKLIDKLEYIQNYNYNNLPCNKVCNVCYNIFILLKNIKRYILIFQLLPININEIYKLSLVSKLWNNASIIYLSNFKDIQYLLPLQYINNIQSKLLYNNFNLIIGHNNLIYQFIKIYNWNKCANIKKILKYIYTSNKIISCNKLLCNSNCINNLSDSNILDLLKHIKNILVRKFIIQHLHISNEYFTCYISFLIHCITLDTIDEPIICNYLIKYTINSEIGLNILFELRYYSENITNIDIFINYYLYNIQEHYNILYNQIIDTYNYFLLYNNNFNIHQYNINNYLKNYNIFNPFVNNIRLHNIKFNCIILKNSNGKPYIIPYNIINSNTYNDINSENANTIMYKYEDLRKDRIITDIIKLINLILMKSNLDIITYKVIPINSKLGIIQIINNASTIYDIIINKKTTLLNYILDNNSTNTIDNIKYKFINSIAVYSIITYLFGIGDRHLDNIMITNNGLLFHIDFSFIFGDDPKLYAPYIRIIPEMINVIGGENSYNFLLFKSLCNKIYNILRKNTDIISNLLSLLLLFPNNEYTEYNLLMQILNRFNPNETNDDSNIYINNTIENSTKSYNQYIDIIYHANKYMKSLFK